MWSKTYRSYSDAGVWWDAEYGNAFRSGGVEVYVGFLFVDEGAKWEMANTGSEPEKVCRLSIVGFLLHAATRWVKRHK